MTDAKQIEFGQRLNRIERHNRKLSRGYVASMNHDGLVVARPRRQGSLLPLRGLFLCLAVMIAFKGFLLAQLGAAAYSDRVTVLETGTFFEKVGAYAMKADPVTVSIAGLIGPYLN